MPNAQTQSVASAPHIPVAILGPTGYTGLDLIEIILRHPSMRVAYLGSAREKLPRIEAEFPRLAGRLGAEGQCRAIDHDAIARECQLAFLCLPHEAAMAHVPELLKRGVKCVDLSAAYRIKDAAVYEKAYGHAHTDAKGLERAVYGLTEYARAEVAKADLVANPGCYPTAAAIALLPLLKAGVIDPAKVVRTALQNAASVAGLMITTEAAIVEAPKKNAPAGGGMPDMGGMGGMDF